jgi:anti-sigma factor ChrR (cupin superfamily)
VKVTDHADENQLALYSTGDLDSSQLEYLEQHVAYCPACRGRLAEFEHIQTIFLSLRSEPSPHDVCDVRTRVMQAIQNRPKPHRILQWAPAAAAVIAAILLFLGNQEPVAKKRVQPPFAVVRQAPKAASWPSAPVRAVRAVRRIHNRPAAGLKSIALLTAADRAPTAKITTSDPNVIILLPPDSSSNERTNE